MYIELNKLCSRLADFGAANLTLNIFMWKQFDPGLRALEVKIQKHKTRQKRAAF